MPLLGLSGPIGILRRTSIPQVVRLPFILNHFRLRGQIQFEKNYSTFIPCTVGHLNGSCIPAVEGWGVIDNTNIYTRLSWLLGFKREHGKRTIHETRVDAL